MFHVGLFRNRWVNGGVTTTVVLQLLFTYTAPMNELFHSAPIDAEAWLRIFAVGSLIWAAVGVEKRVRRVSTLPLRFPRRDRSRAVAVASRR